MRKYYLWSIQILIALTLPEGNHTPEELKWFRNLFDTYYDSIRNFAYFKVGDPDIADDVVQEAFIKVWNMRDEIRSETVKALLYKIAGNLALNQLKHRKVVLNFENNYQQDSYGEQADAQIISDEFNTYLQSVIASMPENSREVFLMNRMEGLTYEEIADRLDLSVKAIEKRMSEALKIVRSKISYKV